MAFFCVFTDEIRCLQPETAVDRDMIRGTIGKLHKMISI
ncbi:hypothetical protein BSM4216_2130 [Bacillus smithii]|nr:hypothetical protein BSM4216_2130 [Bacillus smithii]